MTRRVLPLVLLLASSMALAGCIAGEDDPLGASSIEVAVPPPEVPLPDPVVLLEDAAGDAAALRPRLVHALAGFSCGAPDERAPDTPCWSPVRNATSQVGAGGPPELDLLGVTLHETPSTLVLDVELARVDASFEDVLTRDGYHLEIGVCWDHDGSECDVDWRDGGSLDWPVNPFLLVAMTDDGPGFVYDQVYWTGSGCGGSGQCRQGVPVTLEEGSPGIVRFEVPRGMIPGTGLGERIQRPVAYTYLWESAPDDGYADTPFGPAYARGVQSTATGGGQIVDVTRRGEDHRTVLAPTPPVSTLRGAPDRPDEPTVTTAEGDILAIEVVEDPDAFTFAIELGEVAEEPFDHTISFRATIHEGHELRWDRVVRDGEASVEAIVCPPEGCDRSLPAPVDAEITHGAPGWINLTLPREALGQPQRGEDWAQVTAILEAFEGETVEGPEGRQAWYKTLSSWDALHLPLLRPLQMNSTGVATAHRTVAGVAEDDVGDHRIEHQVMTRGNYGSYDVRKAEAAPVERGVVDLTLSLAELSASPVPDGYDAAVYAVAVEHEVGTTMAYLLRPRSGPVQSYCAEDTLLFTSRPQDPTLAISTPIESLVNYVSTDQSGRGGGTGGSITFLAPVSCFGLGADDPLEARRMAGGTFFLKEAPNVEDRMVPVDRSEDSDPFRVEAVKVATVTPSFWEQPFGLANGWDIIGAALAVLTLLATLILFWRRRRQLQRYLDRIEAIEQEHEDDPVQRAAELVDLRGELHDDLLRHRVSDAHYSIILERLRARITSARLMSVGERIYDVPTNLALRIERLLDDGRLTEEEHRALRPALTKAKVPKETRELLGERLATWVREDAEVRT